MRKKIAEPEGSATLSRLGGKPRWLEIAASLQATLECDQVLDFNQPG